MNAFDFKRHLNFILLTFINRDFCSNEIDIISINTKFDNSTKQVIYEILFALHRGGEVVETTRRFIMSNCENVQNVV